MADSAVKFHDLEIQIGKIRAIGGGAEKYMQELCLEAMQDDIWPSWIKHISLTDHDLSQLSKLGYPYSTRYAADSFVHPDEDVHIQSGDLLANSRIEIAGDAVQLVNSSIEYEYLRYGTSRTRMRDPGGAAMRDALPSIKKRFADGVRNAIINFILK